MAAKKTTKKTKPVSSKSRTPAARSAAKAKPKPHPAPAAKKPKVAAKVEATRAPIKAAPPAKAAPPKAPLKVAPVDKIAPGKATKLQKQRTSAPPPRSPSTRPKPPERETRVIPLPVLAPPKKPTLEERSAILDRRLMAQDEEFRRRYQDSFDMSWIYHDSALEGVVYTFEEMRTALSGQPVPATDSSLQPTYEDIRRHKEAIDFVRDYATNKKRLPITLDVFKKIYLILHPEEGDVKTVKYRKDVPQHRLYFHEYAAPDKIAYKVRQVIDWLNDPETKKTRGGIRMAARVHYDLLRVYPFSTDSGKVARLFMNLLLLRSGLPPSIVHSTERQRYYDALKGSANTVLAMVQESVENTLSSIEKLLDEYETRTRSFVS